MKRNYILLNLPRTDCIKFGLEWGESCRLAAGRKSIMVTIGEAMDTGLEEPLVVVDELARELCLPEGLQLNLKKDVKGLRAGPIAAVLAGPLIKERGSFGAQDRFFRSLIRSMRNLYGLTYVFSPNDVDWKLRKIHGYYLPGDTDGHWQRRWFPLPDVCYNRYYKGVSAIRSRGITDSFRHQGIESFNSAVGNKWRVHKQLSAEKDIAPHLPETLILDSPHALAVLFKRHPRVYVKPVNGCKGRDVTRISKKQKHFLVRTNNNPQGITLGSVQQTYQKVKAGNLIDSLIAQQGIKVRDAEHHFDTRVLVQKDRFNQWHVSGIAARVGANGSVTTNLHTGGRAEKLDKVLADRGMDRNEIESVIMEINRLAIRVALTLDKYSRALGDLGMDFIVDEKGKVWFLEVNPKPGRRSFSLIDSEMRRIAVSRPMEYACYLAGF